MVLTKSYEAHTQIPIKFTKTCGCKANHLNCLTPREWIKSQVGIWQFGYGRRDIRDKILHPATFPLSLAQRVIEVFTHEGELVLDPFVGSGTTLLAAQDFNRNAIGFDLHAKYVELCKQRLANGNFFNEFNQIAIMDDARNIPNYLEKNTVSLIWTSPPYANMLNRQRKNKSRRGDKRRNGQYGKVEQYSQDSRDLGTMGASQYIHAMGEIFENLLPLLRPKAYCVINITDLWWENQRIPLHVAVIKELIKRGYELRNTIIWDKRNLVNHVGMFGWPSNYITLGATFEYLLDFWRPPVKNEVFAWQEPSLIPDLQPIFASE